MSAEVENAKKEFERAEAARDEANRLVGVARAELESAGEAEAIKANDRLIKAEAAQRSAVVAAKAAANTVANTIRDERAAKLPRLRAEADPSPRRARIKERCARRVALKRQLNELEAEDLAEIRDQNDARKEYLDLAKELGVAAETIEALPSNQHIVQAWLLDPPPEPWENLARALLAAISPGSTLPADMDPRGIVAMLVESGPEALLREIRAREADRHARERAALDQVADARRRMVDRFEQLTKASRERVLTSDEEHERGQLEQWRGDADGAYKYLAASAATAARAYSPIELAAAAPTSSTATRENLLP